MVSRAHHRRSTLLKISAATTAAYSAAGAAFTFDDVARLSGLSRRTLFRYVDNKEDLLFIHPTLWLDVFDEAIAEVADAPLRERVLHAAHRISQHIDADPAPVRQAMVVAASDPSFRRGYAGVTQRWIDRISAEVRGDATDSESIFRASVLGAAVMGVIDASIAEWAATEPAPSLVDLVDRGLDYVAPIFD